MSIQNYSLVSLFAYDSEMILSHMLTMSEDDTYLRFGYVASAENIQKYIADSFKPESFWFGVMDGEKLIGTAHIVIMTTESVSEFAFTVDSNYRGQKLGQLLFARGFQLVTEHRIDRIYMVCLSKNSAMRSIAKKFGMSVMVCGTDAEASVTIQYPVPLSRMNEVKVCMIDRDIFK